jgi:hypothetical protein
MYYYQIWCNLKDGSKDLEFCRSLDAYLGYLQRRGLIEGFKLTRRTFGFGPPELGEFCVTISIRDLAQLEQAQLRAASRDNEVEPLHRAVFSSVTGFRSGLFRDFPDEVRSGK